MKRTEYEIVKKLIGEIQPVGETNTDNERYENLQEMCDLIRNLVADVIKVSQEVNRQEYSIKRAGEYASNFIIHEMGILPF